jgi:hypothetical protein
VDDGTNAVYEYANARSLTSGSGPAPLKFALNSGNGSPQDIADPRAFIDSHGVDHPVADTLDVTGSANNNTAVLSASELFATPSTNYLGAEYTGHDHVTVVDSAGWAGAADHTFSALAYHALGDLGAHVVTDTL